MVVGFIKCKELANELGDLAAFVYKPPVEQEYQRVQILVWLLALRIMRIPLDETAEFHE
jgi:hypothetical protein